MPVYDVELSDGRTVTLEGDKEPTEADVLSALGEKPSAPAAAPQPLRQGTSGPFISPDATFEDTGLGFEPTMPGNRSPFQSFVPLPDPIKGETPLGKVGAAAANYGIGMAGSIASPGGLMTLPLGLMGRVGALAGGLGFGLPAVKEGLHRVYEGGAMGDIQEALEGGLQAGTGGLITAGGIRGLLSKPTIPVTPTEVPPPPPKSQGPLLLERGPLLMPEEHPAPPLESQKILAESQAKINEAAKLKEDARIARLQAQKRPTQAPAPIIGEEPQPAQVIPAPSQSIINLARRGAMKLQFDQLQRDFESAQAAGDGAEMGKLQKQMIDLQRQLHPLEVEREQLSGQFEGEGTWPPTSEQLGTFQTKGRTIPTKFTEGPGEEALPSAEREPSTPTEVTQTGKAPGIISGTAIESWADSVLRGGGTHLGPDVLAAYAVKGAAVIERGVRKFADWSAEMVKQFGEDIKPHLRNLYNQSLSIWQSSLDQPKEKAPSTGESGKAQPSAGPIGATVETPVAAGETPQAKAQPNVTSPVTQVGNRPTPTGALGKVRDTLSALWKTKDIRDVMTYKRDAADNQARLFGESQGNDIAGSLSRAAGSSKANGDALSFVVESGGDRGQLGVMRDKIANSDYAGTKWGKAALSAIDQADRLWDKLKPVAQEYVAKTDAQISAENAAGIDTPKRSNYVMHAQEVPDEWGFLGKGDGGGSAVGFRHIREHATFADSIAAGVNPRSLNAVDLLKSRISRGQSLINNRQWVESLRTTVDPFTNKPIVTDPEIIQRGEGLPADHRAPSGYHNEFVGGRPVSVLDGYGGIFDALTSPSKLAAYAGTNALLKSAVIGKSVALMVDTFHLARVAFWESVIKPLSFTDPKVPLPSYKKGVLLLDYTPEEIQKMGRNGDLPTGTVDQVLAGKKIVDGLVSHGYNVGRISDAIHQEWLHSVPALGKVNQFIFKSFQRGAMAEIGVLEYGRYRRMNPSWTDSQVYREVAKDLNTRFGNPGRQGWIKSKTNQDLARLAFLAPQWNEGLIKSELGAITGTVKGVGRSVKEGRPSFGVLPRAVGAMMVGQFAANQLINYATRGHPTWENPEEGFGAKVSAWIPDVVGNGPGFFLHPFGLAAEISHLFEMKMEKNPEFRSAVLGVLGSRLSTLARPVWTYVTGRSTIGGKPIRPEDVNKETIKAAVPLPIGGSAITQAAQQLLSGENKEQFPGQYQKQVMSSVGVKTDQAPSFDQRITALASDFRRKAGLKPSGEFYAGDYDALSSALKRGAIKEATKAFADLQKKKTDSQIIKHFSAHQNYPFTRSRALESQFYESLNDEQKQAYSKAIEERAKVTDSFFKMLGAQ